MPMILTLILFSSLLSLVHYLGMESLLVYGIGLPIEVYISITIFLIIVRSGIALSRFLPSVRRTYRRAENLVSRLERTGADKFDPNNQKRRFSSSSCSPFPGGSRRPQEGRKGNKRPRVREYNILDIVRTRFRVVNKVVSLSNKLIGTDRFRIALRTMFYLALSRTVGLAYRANSAHSFLHFLLKIQQDHGTKFTIKWLKAGYVAIQKELGNDGMESLRVLDPELPLPALASRLPRVIPAADRAEIRNGNVAVIRFWSSLFNLYRIFKCPGEMKISTITAPFSGDVNELERIIEAVRSTPFFVHTKLWGKLRVANLSPSRFVMSEAASPSNKSSRFGLLTDIYLVYTLRRDLWDSLFHFGFASVPEQTPFMKLIVDGANLISDFKEFDAVYTKGKSGKEYFQPDHLMTKNSVRSGQQEGNYLSQFAIKEEAAGKVRVFALIDSLSQTFLAPLHQQLFDILRTLPNDGTFDQDASVVRCQEKAKLAGCAYSFDLTAATDRIPVALSKSIIDSLFDNPYLGDLWRKIMTDRDFYFNGKVASKYKVPVGPYRYSVGQPMGGLSSWAMLALTHHWIVQLAAYRAGVSQNSTWYSNYEILGDDLVIFDRLVADQYLLIMKALGCEINLNKSIVSHDRPVFEFAKRTCIGDSVVSGISFNQLLSNTTVGNRVANVLTFAKSGHLKTVGMVLSLLTRGALTGVSGLKDRITRVSLLALLGSLSKMGRISLKELVTALISPKGGFEGQTISLPYAAALKLAHGRLVTEGQALGPNPEIPWSQPELRIDTFEEHKSFFTVQVLTSATALAEQALANWRRYLRDSSHKFIYPLLPPDYDLESLDSYFDDLPSNYQELIFQLEEWVGAVSGLGSVTPDPAELVEETSDALEQFQYDEELSLESALSLEKDVQDFIDAVHLTEPEKVTHVIQSTPVIGMVRALIGLNRLKVSHAALMGSGSWGIQSPARNDQLLKRLTNL